MPDVSGVNVSNGINADGSLPKTDEVAPSLLSVKMSHSQIDKLREKEEEVSHANVLGNNRFNNHIHGSHDDFAKQQKAAKAAYLMNIIQCNLLSFMQTSQQINSDIIQLGNSTAKGLESATH